MGVIQKFDVTGLGSLSVDFIGEIDTWPGPGTKHGLKRFDIFDGGLTGTALTTVSRLGGRAAFIGTSGISEMSVRSLNALRSEGIDLSMVVHDPLSEPIIAMIFTSPAEKERNVFFQKKNLRFPFPEEIPDKYWTRKTKVFFTDHVAGEAGVSAAREALNAGVEVVVDIERMQENVEGLLQSSSHIIVGEKFACLYSGSEIFSKQVKSLRKKPFQTVVVTRGEIGCGFSVNGTSRHIGGVKVEVVDTTGCGDVFHGAYAWSVSKGFAVDKACMIGNAAAAMKTGHMGGRPGIPNLEALRLFLDKQGMFRNGLLPVEFEIMAQS